MEIKVPTIELVGSDISNNPLNKVTTMNAFNNGRNFMMGTNGTDISANSNIGSGRHMRSIQRDPELEEALDEDS